MTAIREVGGGFEVDAGGATYGAGRVVLAADAWTNELLGAVRPSTAADRDQGAGHVLRRAGSGGVRAGPLPGLDLDGRPVVLRLPGLRRGRPEGRPGLRRRGDDARGPDLRAATRRRSRACATFLAAHLPGALGPEIYTKTCLYTLTPDRDFVVDRLPDAPGVVVGLGAAHGFKYASVLGRILVELARRRRQPVGRRRSTPSGSIVRSCSSDPPTPVPRLTARPAVHSLRVLAACATVPRT